MYRPTLNDGFKFASILSTTDWYMSTVPAKATSCCKCNLPCRGLTNFLLTCVICLKGYHHSASPSIPITDMLNQPNTHPKRMLYSKVARSRTDVSASIKKQTWERYQCMEMPTVYSTGNHSVYSCSQQCRPSIYSRPFTAWDDSYRYKNTKRSYRPDLR